MSLYMFRTLLCPSSGAFHHCTCSLWLPCGFCVITIYVALHVSNTAVSIIRSLPPLHMHYEREDWYCKLGRYIDPHHSTRVPSTPRMTPALCTVHSCAPHQCSAGLHKLQYCPINTETQTFSRRQNWTVLLCSKGDTLFVRVWTWL
jgi:hypothetical protein